MGAESEEPKVVAEEQSSGYKLEFGVLDGILVIVVFGYLIYRFVKRKKTPELQLNFRPVPATGFANVRADSGGFVAKMQQAGRNVAVFYGSQTGTAEEIASRLAKDATRFGMKGVALDPEECDMEDLPKLSELKNGLAIFCMATYGEGDPTDNAQEFYEFLQRNDADLAGLNYAVFGLGNKTYEHFNAMGKYTDKRLAELGAKRVYEMGLGDDDGNLEEDFMLWREGFWPAVCDFFDIRTVGEDISTRQYRLTVHEEHEPAKVFQGQMGRLTAFTDQKPPFDAKNPYLASIVLHKELHSGGDRSCMHIEFDIAGSKLRYEAGDHVAVFPTNDVDLVEEIGSLLEADLDAVFSLTNVDEDSSKKHPFPCPCSYRTALRHYVDLTSSPRTHVLKELAETCSSPEEKEFLRSMTSAKEESRKKYHDWILGDRRTIIDILRDVSSCRPSIDHLLELLPRLQPRYYSISSSPKDNPDVVSITAVRLEYRTRIGRTMKGVCTNYLADKRPVNGLKHKVPIFVRKSQLRLPHQPRTPVLMIGPGTGLAPFRGFLQDRYQQKQNGKEVGPTILYFGCRHKNEDFIYENELELWHKDGTLCELNVAFSRDQGEKVYVQHLLRSNAKSVWKYIQEAGHIYVCGDARNMAKDVHNTIVDILVEEGKMEREEALKFVKKMENQKRYQADVWF